MLDKPPEINNVLGLVKDISALWNELGSKLHVPLNDRQTLRTDISLSNTDRLESVHISLSNTDRLESVLTKWIGNETEDVKWRVVLDALKALQRKDVIKNVIQYLEKPETYTKYISSDDFSPCKY